jgi:hypothetical protein
MNLQYGKPRRPRYTRALSLVLLPLPLVLAPRAADAVEDAKSIYLLGFRGPKAGFVDLPGTYLTNMSMVSQVSGTLHGDVIDATGALDLPILIWMTPARILGGSLGFAVSLPGGWEKVSVRAPGVNIDGDGGGYSDLLVNSRVGWEKGDFHWNLNVWASAPTGDYFEHATINLPIHHWALDVAGALTWFEPEAGIDLSVVVGMTFNSPNMYTNYHDGDELHVEWVAGKVVGGGFTVGLAGYSYRQVTGDSGEAAVFGPFEGRESGIGGYLAYTFDYDNRTISANIRGYRTYDVMNRLDRDLALLTITLPLNIGK